MSDIGNVYYVEADTGPDLLVSWSGQNLTGYTIKLHVRYSNGNTLSITATDVDLANGSFKFVWSPGQLIEGKHRMEIEFVNGSERFTIPAEDTLGLIVRKDIADIGD